MSNSTTHDPEAHLFELIHQAGEDARKRKKTAMEQHIKRLRAAVKRGAQHQNNQSHDG